MCKKNADNGKVNIVGDLGACIKKKCYRNFGTIFNLENWAQTSGSPTVLIVSSQETYEDHILAHLYSDSE